jgi:uncharacterized membrane protein
MLSEEEKDKTLPFFFFSLSPPRPLYTHSACVCPRCMGVVVGGSLFELVVLSFNPQTQTAEV